MSEPIKINFVSDVSCPWCAVGLYALKRALDKLGSELSVELEFEPFELNPNMPGEGQNIVEHISQKYGSSREQSQQSRELIRERAAQVGFAYNMRDESRIYNTFDAHRLLHWAKLRGKQQPLKEKLLAAYLSDGRDPSDQQTLVALAEAVGLDADAAREVLQSGAYRAEVRERQDYWLNRGVHSVPTVVFNEREAVVGGQPPEVFESVLRNIVAQQSDTLPKS